MVVEATFTDTHSTHAKTNDPRTHPHAVAGNAADIRAKAGSGKPEISATKYRQYP